LSNPEHDGSPIAPEKREHNKGTLREYEEVVTGLSSIEKISGVLAETEEGSFRCFRSRNGRGGGLFKRCFAAMSRRKKRGLGSQAQRRLPRFPEKKKRPENKILVKKKTIRTPQ